jgi:hypothetical protein
MPRLFKLIAGILISVFILAFTAFAIYVQVATYPPDQQKLAAVMADDSLSITESGQYYKITPITEDTAHPHIIFYPGGLVDPGAYLFKMGAVALELKTTVYIVKAPFNAAIFNVGAAGKIIDSYGLEQAWVGGHSLGGISACRFAARNPESVYGVFMFGSYCDQDLSGFTGPVVVVIGLNDLIINRENYEAAKANLPGNTKIFELKELNHSDFGNYGLQEGDAPGILSDSEVIEIMTAAFTEGLIVD